MIHTIIENIDAAVTTTIVNTTLHNRIIIELYSNSEFADQVYLPQMEHFQACRFVKVIHVLKINNQQSVK